MALKLYDTKTITETEENVFLSAYLTRKIQYNDVDPDKIIEENDVTDLENITVDTANLLFCSIKFFALLKMFKSSEL